MTQQNNEDFYFEFAMEVAMQAGDMLKKSIGGRKSVSEKLGDWDVVTEHDKNIENVIIGRLANQFPKHKFIAEESAGKILPDLTDTPTWIIDPIDGTANFIHGFPHSCVVIGLAINKEMVASIVYNPMLDQLFTARKGRGAFMNGARIQTSKIQDLSRALVCLEPVFIKVDELSEIMSERIYALAKASQGIRTIGSAALTLCYIALGVVEAYQIEGPPIRTWDIAAPSLIITEAGGVVVDRVTGGPVNLMQPRAIGACNAKIAAEVVRICREADIKAAARVK